MSAPVRSGAMSCLNRFSAETQLVTRSLYHIGGLGASWAPIVVPANRRFLVYHIYWVHEGALSVNWLSGPTLIAGPFISAGHYAWEFRNSGFPVWAGENPGESLTCYFNLAGAITGFVTYAEQEAGPNL